MRREFLSGLPLNIIYEELFESQKLTVQYSGFWKQAHKNINLSVAKMVKIHKPGERAEIDYCDGIDIIDPATGEIKRTHLFVGVLCHSRYAFAEFSLSYHQHLLALILVIQYDKPHVVNSSVAAFYDHGSFLYAL